MPIQAPQTGRKSKYNPQMQAALCRWLKKGCSYKDACAMEGISYETFRTWENEKPVFSVALKKAEAECKAARIATVLKASEKSWQAAAWWLERRCPEEYGRFPKEEPVNAVSYEELETPDEWCKTVEEARALREEREEGGNGVGTIR